jgi:hypothetical protein
MNTYKKTAWKVEASPFHGKACLSSTVKSFVQFASSTGQLPLVHLCLLEIHTHLLLQAGAQNGQITVELLLLMLLCSLASGSLTTMCNASDRDALLAFKAQLIDTEGALNDWDAQTDCCVWTVRLLLPLWILKLTIWLHIIGHGRHHILQLCFTVSYVPCHSKYRTPTACIS